MQMKGVSEKTKQKQFRAERNAEIKSDKCVSQFTMTIRFLFFFFRRSIFLACSIVWHRAGKEGIVEHRQQESLHAPNRWNKTKKIK